MGRDEVLSVFSEDMANTKSALKNDRKRVVRTVRNRSTKTRIKTLSKKYQEAVASGDAEAAKTAAVSYVSTMDRAAKNHLVHPNAVARVKSKVSKHVFSA
jgi:small subunit ribosomal protein S20